MVRGSGKFKVKRGGGRAFSRNLTLDENGTAVSTERHRRGAQDDEDSDDGDEEDEDEDEDDDDGGEDEDEDELIANPNRVTKKLNISDLSAPRELTRREREQKEKKEAKDRYWKLHVQGKTDQAKADLSRLAKIRAEREAATAKRKAEAEEKAKALANAAKSSKR
ncbi:casein kinase substrate phosphoprotein PP28-domain-containing protein [Russula vinacea]|nr:casein kinase substrate phosphoprotein PP28-domain-containing protein [Russula vinacea]